jgi:hypothetical protein
MQQSKQRYSPAAQDAAHAGLPESFDLNAALRILQEVDPSSALYRRTRELLDESVEVQPEIPKATARGESKFLTIGMATRDDYDGCYFTIQAIRLYHPEILDDVEFLVIDNNPAGPCAKALKAHEYWDRSYRYVPYRSHQGTAVRDLIFREAAGDFVLCIDSHVFFPAGALARLIAYCRSHPQSNDLLQGPLLGDDFKPMGMCFQPVWSYAMYGVWGLDERGNDIDSPPFEIEMQGLGAFACRREAWPGFNPRLSGFGGEEGYIHEKIRRAGGRNLCLPFLGWIHRFERPMGAGYSSGYGDRVRNYLLIYDELGLDPAPVIRHFEEFIGQAETGPLVQSARAELASPLHFFDALYCMNLDRQPERWEAIERRFRRLGIERGVRRFSAADTPLNHDIGRALSHRRIVAEAKLQQLQTVLVIEDDVRFSPDAAGVFARSLQEIEGRDWQLLYLGGYRSANSPGNKPGCRPLSISPLVPGTHAIAYHRSVYDAILDALPDNAVDMALWLLTHSGLDDFYAKSLQASAYLTFPAIATSGRILLEQQGAFDE